MEEINHLKLPRKRSKKAKYTTNKLYSIYKKRWGISAKSLKVYNDVTKLISKKLVKKIIEDEWIYRMPLRLGTIGVYDFGKLPQYKGKEEFKINYGASAKLSAELGVKTHVYYENENTDGTIYKICWSKKEAKFEGQRYYKILPNRGHFKRVLPKWIKSQKGRVTYLKKN